MIKQTTRWMMTLLCIAALSGCATYKKSPRSYAAALIPGSDQTSDADGEQSETGATSPGSTKVRPDRMLIWKADLTLEVGNVKEAVCKASAMAERQGGFVEKKSDQGEESACITLRIPSKTFKAAVADLECLGKIKYRNLNGEDVTEKYVDVESRLKNMIALRDRLKAHLDKAKDVKDIIAIEKELNRIQSDIESMQAQIKSLRGQADYATIVLSLQRKTILGPFGYVFKGIWWGVEKLFVIRE